MKLHIFSYRFAEEILQHTNYSKAWNEIKSTLEQSPVFSIPGKSKKNSKLLVVQQVMNTYFDRKFGVDLGWDYHPFATKFTTVISELISERNSADFPFRRKYNLKYGPVV